MEPTGIPAPSRPDNHTDAPAWHAMHAEAVFARLQSTATGLSSAEAAARLARHGPNEIQAAERVSPWSILLQQFKNVLIVILLIATALSAVLGHGLEAMAIAIIVLLAVLLGFAQEYRAERATDALREMAAPTATVLRDRQESEIPARDLVPGDVVFLGAGDRVPADARLIESVNLRLDEAALTGESEPVEKHADALGGTKTVIGDRRNMAYAGTVATYGRGRAVVVGTGMSTEFGRIAQMLQSVETGRTPLQENLDKVGHTLARATFVIVAVIVTLGLFRGQPFIEMFIFGIALAVAAVPEALPAVVTISLAIGVQRMVKRHALMRRLPAVETLGCTSVICSDKTGTLTRDEMTARRVFVAGEELEVSGAGYEPVGAFLHNNAAVEPSDPLRLLLAAAALASDAHIVRVDNRWHVKGDPTEGALVVAAAKAGLHKSNLESGSPRVNEIPFTSETKRMTTLHRRTSDMVAYSKGAPEVIVESCAYRVTEDGTEAPLDETSLKAISAAARKWAASAMRVLAVAYKPGATIDKAETDMTFLGLIGMIDPPRSEARDAIRTCEEAGIRAVMITGDHPLTAEAVAGELGLLKTGRVVTGLDLEAMPQDVLERDVEGIDVYARVSPAHKLRVVTAWQQRDHVVAMTGDGVNDAPALKKADIGIAMGITGTDVTREAAAMTLTDDNFASIVAAVEEGRGIFGNIKKYLMYLLSSNIGEIGLMAGATVAGLPLPLTAVQVLYVNLATDGLPALALAVDPPDPNLMRTRPRNPRTGIFSPPVVTLMAVGGLWSTVVNLALFTWALRSGRSVDEAMTMTFVSLVVIQFFKAYNFRSDRLSVLHKPFANGWLNLSIVTGLAMLGTIVHLPILHEPFSTYSLPLVDWAIVVGAAFSVSPVLEAAKWCVRRGWFGTAG
ncbi:MAG: cation-translocating P-type ATPase [Acidobacteriota bacterium]